MMNHDSMLDHVLSTSRNMLVPWFLMASYLYYHRDVSLLSDDRYDKLCRELDEEWDVVEHRHKHLVARDALKAGTAFDLALAQYPNTVIGAACQLARVQTQYNLPPAAAEVRSRPKIQFTIKKAGKQT